MSAQLTLLRAELSRAQHTAAAAGLSQPPRINLQTAPQIMAGSAQLIATGAVDAAVEAIRFGVRDCGLHAIKFHVNTWCVVPRIATSNSS